MKMLKHFIPIIVLALLAGCASAKNQETRSAVKAVTDAITQENVVVHYCPIDGKRFGPNFKVCPEHNVELKVVE